MARRRRRASPAGRSGSGRGSRVSTLEDANPDGLAEWVPKVVQKLQLLPELRDVTSDLLSSGLEEKLTIDRDTAARLGILPQTIDDTLYDAFGQRQISTIFTQLNQYRVI